MNPLHTLTLACELFPYLALLAGVLIAPYFLIDGRRY